MASFHNSVNLVNHNWIQCTNNAFLVNNFPVWEYPNLEVIVVCQALPGNEVTLSFKMEGYNAEPRMPESHSAIFNKGNLSFQYKHLFDEVSFSISCT